MFFKTGTGGRHGRGRFPVLLLFTVLLGVSLCSPHAQAIDPPATVPSESAIADDAANLSLKKDLDRRYPGLEQRFQSWNSQASAFNAKYTGHDLDDGSKEARAGKTEQARLSKLLTSYENDARAFKADVEKLRLKSAGAPPEPAVSAQVGADRPVPDNRPAITKTADIINAMDALAKRLGWSAEKLAHLDKELRLLGDRRHYDDVQVYRTWKDILDRGPDSIFAQEASGGTGPEFAATGKQTDFMDCAVFAVANATGVPYGDVGAWADILIRQGEWHSGVESNHPQQTIEHVGLNGGEVVMLAEKYGQAEVLPDTAIAKTLQDGHPVMLDVVPPSARGAHEVVLSKTFQHAGETWYEMVESYTGPQRRLYLSANELKAMQLGNAVAFHPDANSTPQLLRKPGDQ